jgi:hypothetical protein
MTKAQIAKRAAKMARIIIDEQPEADLHGLFLDAEHKLEGDERLILLAAFDLLQQRAKAAMRDHDKLVHDLTRLGLSHLEDGNVTSENMDPKLTPTSVDFWPEFYRQSCNVVASRAQCDDININAKLGYAIY